MTWFKELRADFFTLRNSYHRRIVKSVTYSSEILMRRSKETDLERMYREILEMEEDEELEMGHDYDYEVSPLTNSVQWIYYLLYLQ